MLQHNDISDIELIKKIKSQKIIFGGNNILKIYGTLHCKSGRRLKRENRVFFSSIIEAIDHGFRPCGHCMKQDYKKWIYSKQH
jgi:methylphosphotriester-DNA--protein-cysteine methyltransferase